MSHTFVTSVETGTDMIDFKETKLFVQLFQHFFSNFPFKTGPNRTPGWMPTDIVAHLTRALLDFTSDSGYAFQAQRMEDIRHQQFLFFFSL